MVERPKFPVRPKRRLLTLARGSVLHTRFSQSLTFDRWLPEKVTHVAYACDRPGAHVGARAPS